MSMRQPSHLSLWRLASQPTPHAWDGIGRGFEGSLAALRPLGPQRRLASNVRPNRTTQAWLLGLSLASRWTKAARFSSAYTDRSGYPRDARDARRRVSPSAARNKGPILEVLAGYLPHCEFTGREPLDVLEIASGTGEHVAHYAAAMPHTRWQPTEWCGHAGLQFEAQDLEDICASIVAWTEGLPNVRKPLPLDASASHWPAAEAAGEEPRYSAVVAANVAHISPPEVLGGLVFGASRVLQLGGHLFLYGPFAAAREPLAEGNVRFDAQLRAIDNRWGLRKVEQVVELAEAAGLELVQRVPMPSDNTTLVFLRRGT